MSAVSRIRRFPWRHGVQAVFLALCAWIGVEFHLFMRWCADPANAVYVPHPPGAEAFLPISALLSLKYWFITGRVCELHPAGFFIFVAVLLVALLLRKGFCSWICPVGTLGEILERAGRKLLRRRFTPPRWLDWPLRSLAYLLLGFFLWTTLRMDAQSLRFFLYSPFNAAADLRMYQFFAQMSLTTAGVIGVLALLGLAVENAWCRYLCPYGALLGILAFLSPLKVRRNASTCTDCRKCTRVCPARIQVHAAKTVRTDACTGCYQCVEACPVKDTLALKAPVGPAVPRWLFAVLVLVIFCGVTGLAMAAGQWKTVITPMDYRILAGENS